MRFTKLILIALFGLSLVAHPAEARRGRGLAIAAGIGIGAAIASSHHRDYYGYYGGPYYSSYGYYNRPLGYSYYDPYYTPTYRSSQVYPSSGAPMIPGAASFIDENGFRNYRDAYGNYIGREPLGAIVPGRW